MKKTVGAVTMELRKVTPLGLLIILGNISGAVSSCKFGVNCDYPCHCQDDALCDVNDGSCPDGCDDGDLRQPGDYWYTGAWSGSGCQIGNVAYNKNATQHSTPFPHRGANLAIDGNHDPDMRQGHCAHPGMAGVAGPAWWQVDLQSSYVVLGISITNRGHPCCKARTAHLNIHVSDAPNGETMQNICYTVGPEGSRATLYVNCTHPIRGRYVILKRLSTGHQPEIMNICEVQVYGYLYHVCPNGYYGVVCRTPCNCGNSCDELNGECHGGKCLAGWMGNNCQSPCGGGYWGANCLETCRCMIEAETCDRFNGQCMSGCNVHYGGVGCNLEIRFAAWSPTNGTGDIPTGYVVHWRLNDSMTWNLGLNVLHFGDTAEYVAEIDNLEPDTPYVVRVIPFISENNRVYPGFPTEGGPFWTLARPKSNIIGNVSGVAASLFLVLVMVVVIVVLLRCRMRRRNKDNSKPVVADAPKPRLNGDVEHGSVNPVYENSEIDLGKTTANYKVNDGMKNADAASGSEVIKPKPKVKLERVEKEDAIDEIPISADAKDSTSVSPLSDGHIYGNQTLLGRPIKVGELSAYIDQMFKSQGGFKEEYLEIPIGMTAEAKEAQRTVNKKRNRFNDICAYDHSRVALAIALDENQTDYINANYILKYKDDPKGYIATQGPTEGTVKDMWTMVWQTGANRIVMVTKLLEAGKSKCEQYWPSQGVMVVGKFKVALVDTEKFADFTIRSLSLAHEKDESRPVYHFHFTGWPDNDIPDEATSLLNFRRKVRSYDNLGKGPMIVHCSAGVGRTGTFIGVDYLLDQAKNESMVDVFTYTALMRNSRMSMIQTLGQINNVPALIQMMAWRRSGDKPLSEPMMDQYVFVYKALLEALQIGETAMPSYEIEARYIELKKDKDGKSITKEQFALLQCLKRSRKLAKENTAKNRSRNVMPKNTHRPVLSSHVDGTNDYINAVYVDGYRERQAYIATQLPLPNTIVDLWRLLYDEKCSCLITLEQPDPNDKKTAVYWPTARENSMVFNQLHVKLQKEEKLDNGATKMLEFEITLENKDPRNVRMYQFLPWSAKTETPTSIENTLTLLDHAQRWQLRSEHGPLCFLCKYGYERCGLIIAACYVLEKLKVDREVDVFQAVKQIRIPRPELVASLTQYEFLHELAIAYINSCEDYANFK